MKGEILGRNRVKTVSLNRRKAVRERCLNCSGWSFQEVEGCSFTDCPLSPFRSGKGKQNAKDRNRAIKDYCRWCMAGEKAEIKKCVSVHCPLFTFRRGTTEKMNPVLTKGHIEHVFEANFETE